LSDPAGSSARPYDGRRRAVLVLDTATSQIVAAVAAPDGRLEGLTTWRAGHRHGETLLPAIARLLGEANVRRSRIAGVVVGTGPGAFTGLRVGVATAKGVARALRVPMVGVPTSDALVAALAATDGLDPDGIVLVLPAGPSDRVICFPGQPPRLVVAGHDVDVGPGQVVCAVDLEGRAPADAVARGERARDGLGAALGRIGCQRLARGDVDDMAKLVPEYVTLPRGVRDTGVGEVAWSHARP
jgi:tRNA threonylcarbamoyl adenosine modification protein YeaZ